MFRRVVTRGLGIAGGGQSTTRVGIPLVVRDAKHSVSAICVSPSPPKCARQTRALTTTQSNNDGSPITTESTEYTSTEAPVRQKKARKPRKAVSESTAQDTSASEGRGRARKITSGDSTSTKAAKKPAKSPSKPKKKVASPKKAAKKPAAKKPRVKKALTAAQAYVGKIRTLQKEALLDTPKLLPPTAYGVYFVDQSGGGPNSMKSLAEGFKALPLSEREHYQNIAQQNKIANAKTVQVWTEKHTPDDIRIANNARRQLNKIARSPLPEGRKNHLGRTNYHIIKDARAVKRSESPYIAFSRERWASGELTGISMTENARQLAAAWKALSDEEKQKYKDAFAMNKEQYLKDYNAIFTRGKRSPPKTPVKSIAE